MTRGEALRRTPIKKILSRPKAVQLFTPRKIEPGSLRLCTRSVAAPVHGGNARSARLRLTCPISHLRPRKRGGSVPCRASVAGVSWNWRCSAFSKAVIVSIYLVRPNPFRNGPGQDAPPQYPLSMERTSQQHRLELRWIDQGVRCSL